MKSVLLSEKEQVILWSVAAWFQKKPLVTGTLMQKLYPNLDKKQYKYDKQVEDRLIEIGKWLEKKRESGELRNQLTKWGREGGSSGAAS